jgi:3-oxoacyl-[acyl-carrier protein] reductase
MGATKVATTALVTGGNRGIGLATAEALHAAGHTVIIGSRSGQAPSDLPAVALDVTVQESVDAAFSHIEETFGTVGILVANAGITRDTLLMRMSDQDIDDVLQTNLVGALRVTRRAAKSMLKARTGRIVFVSSVVWALGSAGQVNYAAAKAGLVGAARSLAREFGSRGITTNVVAPGFVETDMTAELSDEQRSAILAAIPSGRYANSSEIADVIAFLCRQESGYINGAVIPVDGGLGMGH